MYIYQSNTCIIFIVSRTYRCGANRFSFFIIRIQIIMSHAIIFSWFAMLLLNISHIYNAHLNTCTRYISYFYFVWAFRCLFIYRLKSYGTGMWAAHWLLHRHYVFNLDFLKREQEGIGIFSHVSKYNLIPRMKLTVENL